MLLAFRVGHSDPEAGLAVCPPHHFRVFIQNLEAEEIHQRAVEGLGFFEISDGDGEMINSCNSDHVRSPDAPFYAATNALKRHRVRYQLRAMTR